jgi:hypothetical protein
MYFHRYAPYLNSVDSWPHVFSTDNRRKSRCFGGLSKEQLAGGPRARRKKRPTSQVPKLVVDAWLKKAKSSFGIRSIICLPDDGQLRLYKSLRMGLLSCYRTKGFRAEHIPVHNYQHPALSDRELEKVWKAYNKLEKPVLIHCRTKRLGQLRVPSQPWLGAAPLARRILAKPTTSRLLHAGKLGDD